MIDKNRLPNHIAIIMDGNGRWAKERGLPRTVGHRQGVKRVEELVSVAAQMGIKMITFFAFSTENWSRPKSEIDTLMRYLDRFLNSRIDKLNRNNIRFVTIGRDEPLPKLLQKKLKEAQILTQNNTGMTLILALNYGSRQEIVDAVKKIAKLTAEGKINIENFEEDDFSRYLYTAGLPDPDLLIRTSAEKRISNFMLWQLSYAELYFPKKYWPDFNVKEFKKAIEEYQKRERRFGRIYAKKESN